VTPNASEYNPDPDYLAELIGSTGLDNEALAAVLGVDRRTINRWRKGDRQFPYIAQFAIEALVLSPD